MHDEFPALFRYPPESRELLRQLRYRHKLVKLRTMVANTLHALAINCGVSLRAQLLTRSGRKQLAGLRLSLIAQQQRDELVSLADELSRRVVAVERWLKEQASQDARVTRFTDASGSGLVDLALSSAHARRTVSLFIDAEGGRLRGFRSDGRLLGGRKVYGGISKARDCCVICWWRRAKPPISMTNS